MDLSGSIWEADTTSQGQTMTLRGLKNAFMHMRDKYDLEIYLEPGEAVALDAGISGDNGA